MKQKVNTQVLVKSFGIMLVLVLSFWAIKPLFAPGFFPMHDDTQVARVFEMGKALQDGMFPVRWVPDLGYGYGYPIFNFYAPLAYYVGGLLTILGFDALIATKIMMGIGILLAGIFMHLLAREFWGELGGIVSSLFYVYAPYHAVDIYVRGDIAEFWAYAFIPLMFLGIYKVFLISHTAHGHSGDPDLSGDSRIPMVQRDSGQSRMTKDIWKWVVVGSLGYAGVILSHNLTAMMVTPFLFIATLYYCYIAYRRKKLLTTYCLLLAILLGLMFSAFYWLPALLEMKYTNVLSQIGGGANFRDHFVCIGQIWESTWGFGGSIPGCTDGLSFKIGKLHALSVLISLFLTVIIVTRYFKRAEAKYYNDTYHYSGKILIVWLCILGFVLSVFFTLEASRPIWEIIPQIAFFQYPWRFLILASFFSSLLSGFLIWFLQRAFIKVRYLNTVLYLSTVSLIFSLIYLNSKLFQQQTLFLKTVEDYTNESTLKWFTSKISDEYMPANFVKPASVSEIANNKISILEGEANIIEESNKTHKTQRVIDAKKETKLKINIAYFPAWNVFLDGKKVLYMISDNSLIVLLSKGRHSLDIEFTQTPIEKIANSISLISLIVLFTGIIFTRKFHYE